MSDDALNTSCSPDHPMDVLFESANSVDFDVEFLASIDLGNGGDYDVVEAVLTIGQIDEKDLQRYRPRPQSWELRDVRREWKEGRFHRLQERYNGVDLVWLPTPFDGVRPWYRCNGCERRCAVLIRNKCRLCRQIRYQSQYDSRLDRIRAKVEDIREQLGQPDNNVFGMIPSRPRGMRHSTYTRLIRQLGELQVEAAGVIPADNDGFIAEVRKHAETALDVAEIMRKQEL